MKSLKLTKQGQVDAQKIDRMSIFGPIIFCFICGVLLIIFGEQAVKITAYALAAGMFGFGVWAVIIYIRSGELERITQSNLAIGLVLIAGGIMLAVYPDYMDDFLPFLWGLSLLFGGFRKIQYAFDEKTVKVEKWWIMLIFAAISIVLGVFVLLKPAFIEQSKYLIMGIMLVLEAVIDLMVYLLLRNALKKQGINIHGDPHAQEEAQAQAPVQEQAQVPAQEQVPAQAQVQIPAQEQAPAQVQLNIPESVPAAAEPAEVKAETGKEEEKPKEE